MILQLRMLSDEDDYFLRDYEVPAEMTLAALHDFICSDLGYEREAMTSFFTADDRWERLREYTLADMSAGEEAGSLPPSMEKTRLDDVIRRQRDRLVYQFDLIGDRALYLEAVEAKRAAEGVRYPRVMLANGEAPDQFDASVPTGNRSIFDEAMGDFNDFSGDDGYDDE